jgi:hypothetical protein
MFNKQFKTLVIVAMLTSVSTVAMAASPNRNVPSNAGIEKAAVHAANAGINLLNTIASDAGAGNGPEVIVSGVTTDIVTSNTTDTAVQTVSGEPTSSTSTTDNVTTGPVSDWTRVDQGQGKVYKKYQDVTTTTTTTETTTTPQTEVTTTTVTNYETPVTTTSYDEIDPGKSHDVNQSPEEGAPDPLVETGETVQVGEPEVSIEEVALDPIADTQIIDETSVTETETVDLCNTSTPQGCPF